MCKTRFFCNKAALQMFLAQLLLNRSSKTDNSNNNINRNTLNEEPRAEQFSKSFRLALSLKKRRATIHELNFLTPSILELLLKVEESDEDVPRFQFYAGQWISIYTPSPSFEDRAEFSIASSPELLHNKRLIALIVRIPSHIENRKNPVLKYLAESAKKHDPIEFKGPGGSSFYRIGSVPSPAKHSPILTIEKDTPIVLIGGGTGLAPMLSILRHLICNIQTARVPSVTMIISVRNVSDIIYKNELIDVVQRYKNITILFTITRIHEPVLIGHNSDISLSISHVKPWKKETFEIWCGWTGRLNEQKLCSVQLFQNQKDSERAIYFLCGHPTMVDSINELLTNRGIKSENIRYDKWW